MTDDDFKQLASDLATLPAKDRGAHLLEYVRHELDKARSTNEWDSVHGLSSMLGAHAEPISAAMVAPEPAPAAKRK